MTSKHPISSSPLLVGFYALVHAGALVSLLLSSLPPVAGTLIILAVLLSAWVHIREQALRCTPGAVIAFAMDEKGHCRLWQRNQVYIEDLQLTGGANTSLGLCLNLRSSRGRARYLNIARDAMPGEALRSLRMRFEHALAHGDDAGAAGAGIPRAPAGPGI